MRARGCLLDGFIAPAPGAIPTEEEEEEDTKAAQAQTEDAAEATDDIDVFLGEGDMNMLANWLEELRGRAFDDELLSAGDTLCIVALGD